MDRDPTAKLTWTVTLVPDVDDPNFGDIDRTAFHYGRTHARWARRLRTGMREGTASPWR